MIRDLVCELGTERALFRNTLERLLSGLVSGDVELALLLDNPRGPGWRVNKLDQKLRLRLHDSFGVYMESVEGIETHLTNLQDQIGLDKNGRPTWYDARTHKKAWKKFMVCLSREEHNLLLEKVDKNNKNLNSLTKDSLDLEPTRLGRRRGGEPFRKIRDCARSLHNVLQLSWSCACGSPHSADLRLEMRESDAAPSFRVLFPHASGPSPSQPDLFIWRETIIRPLEAQTPINKQHTEVNKHMAAQVSALSMTRSKSHMAVVSSSFQLSAIGGPLSDQNNLPFVQSKLSDTPKKRVAWARVLKGHPNDSGQSTRSEPTAEHPSDIDLGLKTNADNTRNSNLSKIADLCHALKNVQTDLQYERCLGCLADENSSLGVYAIRQQPASPRSQPITMTLDDLLNSNIESTSASTAPTRTLETRKSVPHLTKKNRLRLAVTLASTSLQLHTTPWLQKRWGKKDILFHDGSTEHAFVSRNFSQVASEPDEASSAPAKVSWTPVRNESIFNLGVLLLELSYGKSLDTFQSPDDPPMFTEYAIASRLVDHLAEEESSGYVDAARACIFCDFGTKVKTSSLDNEAFRQAVYDDVLVPLEDDWKHWNRSSP
ncbi:MAG: hypothetical protein ASARMPREDX12_004140 [Alectoria sarmentosa]|nr:MAG: hypothetical protein ASARMPREDX12_004140 [Alectoria sarmentosa]